MCEPFVEHPSRREVLGLAAAVGVGAAVGLRGDAAHAAARPAIEVVPDLHIHPRAAWSSGFASPPRHAPETVRFLLVHHTATPNDGRDPQSVIRQAYGWHTSARKGWSDVAYHFFVGHDGSVWEGRAGSLRRPVVADATGGNQGFAQLVCLIGDFTETAPTPAAQHSLVRLLAWLRWRHRLPADPAATVEYVSRGSNRHPAGRRVETPVIAAHRDASATACPGDAAAAMLPAWRQAVSLMPSPAASPPTYPGFGAGQLRRTQRFEPR